MPTCVLAANWKMHKTSAEAIAFLDAFLPLIPTLPKLVEIVIAPPFTALAAMRGRLGDNTRIHLAAQNVNAHPFGAFTGEISLPMLAEFGVTHVIVGHSERRQYFGETDEDVNNKVRAMLTVGVTPIIAVGESRAQRDGNATIDTIVSQTRNALAHLTPSEAARTILAYEPIWAIGTGLNCDVTDANTAMHAIRNAVDGLSDVPILYGGSMKPENVERYLAAPEINGGLIGGAALQAESFAEMIRYAV